MFLLLEVFLWDDLDHFKSLEFITFQEHPGGKSKIDRDGGSYLPPIVIQSNRFRL